MNEIHTVAPGDVPPPSTLRTDWSAFAASVRSAGGAFKSIAAPSGHSARTAVTRLRGKGQNPLAELNEFDVRIEGVRVFAAALNAATGDEQPEEVGEDLHRAIEEGDPVEETAPAPEEVDYTEPAPIAPDEVYVDVDDLPDSYFDALES